MFKKLMPPVLLFALASLTACATQTTGTGSDVVCLAFPVITYSEKHDTPETVEQIREFDAARKAICN